MHACLRVFFVLLKALSSSGNVFVLTEMQLSRGVSVKCGAVSSVERKSTGSNKTPPPNHLKLCCGL